MRCKGFRGLFRPDPKKNRPEAACGFSWLALCSGLADFSMHLVANRIAIGWIITEFGLASLAHVVIPYLYASGWPRVAGRCCLS
jgi:hypothetical protein